MGKKVDNKPYSRKIEKPWGWEIHWVADGMPYMGKLMHTKAGHRWSLQYHDKKQESWFLISGEAKIIWDDDDGNLIETVMEPGVGYTADKGQRHRVYGITECEIIEVSTPEVGKTFRLEDDYNRAGRTEDEKERELRNKGKI